jgi:hypothetical protein
MTHERKIERASGIRVHPAKTVHLHDDVWKAAKRVALEDSAPSHVVVNRILRTGMGINPVSDVPQVNFRPKARAAR